MKKNRILVLIFISIGALLVLGGAFVGANAIFHFLPKSEKSATAEVQKSDKPIYYCPMHTFYTSEKPGSCPICGMDLVLKTDDAPSKEGGDNASPNPSVFIAPDKQALVGIVTSEVSRRDLTREVRTVGRVVYDPDLYLAQEQYLRSLQSYESVTEEVRASLYPLVASAEKKLYLLGMTKQSIRKLVASGQPWSGLYAGSDVGKVWISIAIYENDISLIREGLEVVAESPSWPGTQFKGKISLIPAVLDPETRSLQVKAEIRDPGSKLRAEMVLDTVINIALPDRLAIPEEAVLLTGARKIVFVADDNNHFTVRDLQLGALADGFYEVLHGLKEGDRVVSSGAFFLDSEARLKSSFTGEERVDHGNH